ncbi:hypothetical protein [Streptomyces sp. NPDC048386]|uniref:hypothetical protein n=1 Tax=Streptomyces sp. NPDC048386 TaxID=3365541 RepID=UPI00372239C1
MRETKHAAPQPWRRRGLVTGVPSALLVVGVPACRPTGSGTGVRITDIHGERLAVDGTAVQPDVARPTGVRFARQPAGQPSPPRNRARPSFESRAGHC